MFNPFTAVALIAATIITGLIGKDEKTLKDVKKKVTDALVAQISADAPEESDKIANIIVNQFGKVTDSISDALDTQITQVTSQVQGIISEMNKGQANVDARKRVIHECESKIKTISTNLDTFTFELIEQQ